MTSPIFRRFALLLVSGASIFGFAISNSLAAEPAPGNAHPPGSAPAPGSASAHPPNVLFILADDLGWMDTSGYGSTFYDTPHIDRLIDRGMKFTNAYSASPLCSPTRASILTGLHPARIGFTAPRGHHKPVVLKQGLMKGRANLPWLEADTVTRLDTTYTTLAEVFRDHGYRTGHFGKWHLGLEPYSPLEHGYDVDIPHWFGPGPRKSYLAPWQFGDVSSLPDAGRPGEHIDDRMTDEAIAFIKAAGDQPFYVAYWAFSVHGPWDQKRDVKPELLEKYKGKLDSTGKREQNSPVMGGMIEAFDDTVGRLLDVLDDNGLAENTIIVFMSDNGGAHWHAPEKHGYADRQITSNAPLRGGKATIYEGGTRVPMGVVYPGKIAPGTVEDTPVISTDFFPTLLTLTGMASNEPIDFDGRDLSPLLTDKVDAANAEHFREPIFIHFPHGWGDRPGYQPASSLRDGDWKIIRFYGDKFKGKLKGRQKLRNSFDRYELFNLAVDVSEKHDLSNEKPEKLAEMKSLLNDYLKDTGAVIPTANPNYQGPMTGTPEVENFNGWVTKKHTRGEIKAGRLVVDCVGGDPYLTGSDVPAVQGTHVFVIRMKSALKGDGDVFFHTRDNDDFKSQRVTFAPDAGGEWETLRVPIEPTSPLTVLRFDPANDTGTVEIESIALEDAAGKVVKAWRFDGE